MAAKPQAAGANGVEEAVIFVFSFTALHRQPQLFSTSPH